MLSAIALDRISSTGQEDGSPYPADDAVENRVGRDDRHAVVECSRGQKAVERVAVGPVHGPGPQADVPVESGEIEPLRLGQFAQPLHMGRNLRSFAEPGLLADLI